MIWVLLLTVCGSDCFSQVVSTHNSKEQCIFAQQQISSMPKDGHWKTVSYNCELKNGTET